MGCLISPYSNLNNRDNKIIFNFNDSSSENLSESNENEKLLFLSAKKAISSQNMEYLGEDDSSSNNDMKTRETNSSESSPNLLSKSKYNKTRKHLNFPLFQTAFIDNPIFSKFNNKTTTTANDNKRLSSNSGKTNKVNVFYYIISFMAFLNTTTTN
jgi:hypothetical protein